jgi:tetratricopeptide (TPR) repeat protein
MMAIAWGKIADIYQAQGQLDMALSFYKVQIPIFERLGDIHSRAASMERIADILQARGQLDEALRIHQEEVLPVFERLGDLRAKAITMGKIAKILDDREQEAQGMPPA